MDSYLKTFNLNKTEKGLSKLKKLKNPLDSFKNDEKAGKVSRRVPVVAVEEEFKMQMKDDPTALICSPMNMSAKL